MVEEIPLRLNGLPDNEIKLNLYWFQFKVLMLSGLGTVSRDFQHCLEKSRQKKKGIWALKQWLLKSYSECKLQDLSE